MEPKRPYSEWTKKELVDFVDHFTVMMSEVLKLSQRDTSSGGSFRYHNEPARPPQHLIDSLSPLTDAQLDARLDMLLEEASAAAWLRDQRAESTKRT